MATQASDALRYIADQFVKQCGYSSASLSGLVPDRDHLDSGGYHCSVNDLKAYGNGNDYSNTRPDDRNLNPAYCAAFDVSLNAADMIKSHGRIRKVWADHSDPRRKYINAINTWDGSGDAVRLDFYANTATFASPDHKWHVHGEVRRRYAASSEAAEAIVSVLKGETKAQWLASAGQTGADMALDAADKTFITSTINAKCWGYPFAADASMLAKMGQLFAKVDLIAGALSDDSTDREQIKAKLVQIDANVGQVDEAVLAGLTGPLVVAIGAALAAEFGDLDTAAVEHAVETGVRNVLGSLNDQP